MLFKVPPGNTVLIFPSKDMYLKYFWYAEVFEIYNDKHIMQLMIYIYMIWAFCLFFLTAFKLPHFTFSSILYHCLTGYYDLSGQKEQYWFENWQEKTFWVFDFVQSISFFSRDPVGYVSWEFSTVKNSSLISTEVRESQTVYARH